MKISIQELIVAQHVTDSGDKFLIRWWILTNMLISDFIVDLLRSFFSEHFDDFLSVFGICPDSSNIQDGRPFIGYCLFSAV